jgi:hypothetical protein
MKNVFPHILAIVALLILAMIFCKPALEGKVLSQSDNVQWQAMAKEAMDYKQTHGIPPLWTTSMFGGMPTFQIAMETPYDKIGSVIPGVLTLGLPKPVNMLFLSALCFYILCVVLGVNPWLGFFGALGFTYASYSLVIIATGHDSKMMALAYMPAVLAGLILITQKKYLTGSAIMTVFLAYLIGANHLQMTYYFFLMLGIFGAAYLVQCIKKKEIRHLLITASVIIGCVILSVCYNAVTLWTTYEYSKASNRGGTSELTPLNKQAATGGVDREYAFQWSYGKFETFTLLVPGIIGGSSGEKLDNHSATYKQLVSLGMGEAQAEDMIRRWPMYWGEQSSLGTSGPVYMGIVVCLLAILGLFVIKSWHQWWLIAVTVVGILLAWGSNFPAFNYFVFDHLPFYNKFRAPSQSLVLPQLTLIILAVMTLNELINGNISIKSLKWTGGIIGGLLVLLLAASGSFSYNNITGSDEEFHSQLVQMSRGNTSIADNMMTALRSDRESLYQHDVIRALIIAGIAFGIVWFFMQGKLNQRVLIISLTVLTMFDLLQVDHRYLNNDNFMDKQNYANPFQPSQADAQIMQDKSYYRVFDISGANPFSNAMPSYFHKSIGGYHAAKLQIYQDLIERQISQNNIHVLNMLNTKYVIQRDQSGQPVAMTNQEALGNAWFVKQLDWKKNADEEMNALTNFDPATTAVIDERFKATITSPVYDSTAKIQLIRNDLNHINYISEASTTQFAVFSEIYYEKGWKAFIDDKPVSYARVNYALRGMNVPAGKHSIRFSFEPSSYYSGIRLSLACFVIMLLLITGSVVMYFVKQK